MALLVTHMRARVVYYQRRVWLQVLLGLMAGIGLVFSCIVVGFFYYYIDTLVRLWALTSCSIHGSHTFISINAYLVYVRVFALQVVKSSAPLLMGCIFLGSLLLLVNVFVLIPTPDQEYCMAQMWVEHIALTVTLSAVILKTWRYNIYICIYVSSFALRFKDVIYFELCMYIYIMMRVANI